VTIRDVPDIGINRKDRGSLTFTDKKIPGLSKSAETFFQDLLKAEVDH